MFRFDNRVLIGMSAVVVSCAIILTAVVTCIVVDTSPFERSDVVAEVVASSLVDRSVSVVSRNTVVDGTSLVDTPASVVKLHLYI